MSMFERFARDASESLFNSIYSELYNAAEREQRAIYRSAKRKLDYRIGQHQTALSEFCHGRMSIGHVLAHLRLARGYTIACVAE